MKETFLDLLETDYDQKYLHYLKMQNLISHKLQSLFVNQFFPLRETICEEYFKTSPHTENEKKELANPFYIGFGNPNSDLLIIGKEKAFKDSNLKLMVHESINNYAQWNYLVQQRSFEADQMDVCKDIGFSPLLPRAYHNGSISKNSTWGKISVIVNKLYPEEDLHFEELSLISRSVFNKCFLTELNYYPAKRNEGSGLSDIRKPLLKHPFYKSFPIVIVGAQNYLGKNADKIILELFEATKERDEVVANIGKKSRKIVLKIYRSNNQVIYLCNQLSGASGWSNEAISNFVLEIKKTYNL